MEGVPPTGSWLYQLPPVIITFHEPSKIFPWCKYNIVVAIPVDAIPERK